MSFSKVVKEELSHINSTVRHCRLVEFATIFLYEAVIIEDSNKNFQINIQHEQQYMIRKYFTLLEKTFNIKADIQEIEQQWNLSITNQEDIDNIFLGLKMSLEEIQNQEKYLSSILLKNSCCKRSFLKTVFLSVGSMSDPEKGYHLEFVCTSKKQAEQIIQVIAHFEIEAKSILRKKHWVVYLKEGSSIVELLNVMGAHVSLMNLENLRIVKEVRNTVNRRVNCETANIFKTITASSKQIADIQKLIEYKELERLPQNLQEMAQVRMEYPDVSLQELGKLLNPKVGKSGVNHRLRKLSEKADLLTGIVYVKQDGNGENYDSKIN